MKNIYKNLYDKDVLQLSKNPRVKIMLDMINGLRLRNKKILDIGCYDGTLLSQIKNKKNLFHGIEANDYCVKQCKKKGIKVKNFFFDDKTSFPYVDNFFDLIIIGEIIEHVYDTDFFLRDIHRILSRNGRLILSTPNIASFGRRIMLLLGINPILETSPNEAKSSGHIRYFTFETITTLLNKNGFIIEEIKSDIVNLSSSGKTYSKFITKIFPKIGQSIIISAKKK